MPPSTALYQLNSHASRLLLSASPKWGPADHHLGNTLIMEYLTQWHVKESKLTLFKLVCLCGVGSGGELCSLWLQWDRGIIMCLQPRTDKTIILHDLQHQVRSSVCTTCQSMAAPLTAGRSSVWVEAVWCNNTAWEEGARPLGYFSQSEGLRGMAALPRP